MKKFYTLSFFLIFLIIYLIGCKSAPSDQRISNNPLRISKTSEIIEFQLDSLTSNTTIMLSSVSTLNQELLFYLNSPNNEIQVFDINSEKLIKRLRFDKEGPKGVGKISGFRVKNLDSLYLFPHSRNEFYLSSFNDPDLFSKVEYVIPQGYTAPYVISSLNSTPIITTELVLVKSLIDGRWRQMLDAELQDKSLGYTINLRTGNVSLLPHKYPQDYWKDYKKDFQFSFTSSDDMIVYSFFADHNLYFSRDMNWNSPLLKTYQPSKYFTTEFPEIPIDKGREAMTTYFASSPNYKSILYDRYRNCFYRFCYPNFQVTDKENLMKYRRFSKKFSIMVLDNNLDYIDEILVDDNEEFNPNNAFVSRRGLYISLSNPDNPNNEEDFLKFQLFKLESSND